MHHILCDYHMESSFAKTDKRHSGNELEPSFSQTLLGVHTGEKYTLIWYDKKNCEVK